MIYPVQDRTLINSYRTETVAKQTEIEALTDTSHPQVFQVTRCTRCNQTLDLPSIHFMCKHSFHQMSVCSSPFVALLPRFVSRACPSHD
jgi:hypothetical protein